MFIPQLHGRVRAPLKDGPFFFWPGVDDGNGNGKGRISKQGQAKRADAVCSCCRDGGGGGVSPRPLAHQPGVHVEGRARPSGPSPWLAVCSHFIGGTPLLMLGFVIHAGQGERWEVDGWPV